MERLAINQITTPSWSLPEAIDGYARHGAGGIGLWHDRVEEHGVDRTVARLRDAGLFAASLCTSAWLPSPDAAGVARAVAENEARLEMAARLGAPTLIVVLGGDPGPTRDLAAHRERAREVLERLLPAAQRTGVTLGLEPLHPMYAGDRSNLNTLRAATDLCDALGPGAGLVADVYHCWWDPELEAQLARAGPERIVSFHWSDWRVPTRNLRDRAMPGDGVIDLAAIRGCLDRIGYAGPMELEIFSELDWWQRDPEETTRIGLSRCATIARPLDGR